MLNSWITVFFFQHFEYMSSLCILAFIASDKKSNVLLRIPWNESFFFLLISRFSYCCCLLTIWLWCIQMHINLNFPCLGLLSFLDLQINAFHQTENVSGHYFFKWPLCLLISLISFWNSHYLHGMLDGVP